MPESFKNGIMESNPATLQIGILNIAPVDVLMVSPLIWADPFLGIMIASTPAHSAVRTIAPKFRTSEILSRIRRKGFFPRANISGIMSSICWNSMGAIKPIMPWWFFRVIRSSFCWGTLFTAIPFSFAMAIISFAWGVFSEFKISILSKVSPD